MQYNLHKSIIRFLRKESEKITSLRD